MSIPLDIQKWNLAALNYAREINKPQSAPDLMRITLEAATEFGAGLEGLAQTLATILHQGVSSASAGTGQTVDEVYDGLRANLAPDVA